MKNTKTLVVALLIQFMLSNAWCAAKTITVDPGGKIKTLEAARDAVRKLRADGEKGNIDVIIKDGTYTLDETLSFGLEDSAPEGAVTRYMAAKGASPLISGGKIISGWEKTSLQDGKVWKAKVPWAKDKAYFFCLYDGKKLLPRARSEAFTANPQWIKTREQVMAGDRGPKYAGEIKYRMSAVFPKGLIKDWNNIEDVELYGKPSVGWLINYLGIKSVDTENSVAQLSVPSTYTMRGTFYAENRIEYLDTAGEWALNSKEGILYYWPESGTPGDQIIAPAVDELIRVEGINDASLAGTNDKPVEGIEFIGLRFAYADRQQWTPDGPGVAHDWGMWDKANGLIRFRGAKRCAVRNSLFSDSGSDGVRMDLYCQNIVVEGCTFRHLGGIGVIMAGYGPGKKDVNKHNTITQSEFFRNGTLFLHSPGLLIWQSGHNTISHNRIHDLSYNGMIITGVRRRFFDRKHREMGHEKDLYRIWDFPEGTRESIPTIRWDEITLKDPYDWNDYKPYMHSRKNIIEFNEISDCLKKLHDGNGIYLSAHGEGNIVRYNAAYNHLKGAMIRTDDDSHDCFVSHNLMIGTISYRGYDIKGLHDVRHNICINATLHASHVGNNIDPKTVTTQNVTFYKGFMRHSPSRSWRDIEAGLNGNLYYATGGGAEEHLQQLRDLTRSPDAARDCIIADPMFVDLENGDLSFKPGSPAIKLGVEPMSREIIEKMGMSRDPFINRYEKVVESIPVHHR